MGAKIELIEYYLPRKIISNKDLEEKFHKWKESKVFRKTGIRNRHVAEATETALDLAIEAGNKLCGSYDKTKIDFLIYCTQSPEYYLPSGACIIQTKLGLQSSIGAVDINLGCSGYIYGLSLAKGLIYSETARNVLLITAETYSKYINERDLANLTIFGDAATATLISNSEDENILKFSLGTDGTGAENLIVKNGGLKNRYNIKLPGKEDDSGNIRSDNNLYMNGPEIFNFTISHVPITFKDTLARNNLSIDDLDLVIFHQANKYILKYLQEICGISEDKFYLDLEETGNTVSSTIPIALKKAQENKKISKGNIVLLLGFGVGYSWGGTVIKI
ncbi:MAG: ketoacyl-ACP synthase III [Candidatus Stygibacter frigidus]|nr:ketoacyl-ACP synthase III [Candidatus Stygibacter frigidus]